MSEDLDDIADRDDLVDVLRTMQSRISHLEGRVDALNNARQHLLDEIDRLEADNEHLRARLDEVEDNAEILDATVTSQSRGKLDKILAILDYADRTATGGRGGVSMETGEVAAAASASRDTARRLMDELAANFDWAEVTNPGGPRQKQLRITRPEDGIGVYRSDVADHYGADEGAVG